MTTTLHVFCLVVGAIIFPLRVAKAVRNRDVANIAFCSYIGLSVVSYILLLPPVYIRIDRAIGILNSSGMLSAVSVLGLTAAQQALLMHWAFPAARAMKKTRLRLFFFGALIAAFIAAFFVWKPEVQKFATFYVYYTRHPLEAPYLMIYIVGCVIGQFDVVRHCVKYARVADQPWIRRGMWITACGASLILIYCAIRIADVTCGQLGMDLTSLEPCAWLCGDLGSALAMVGWVVPNVGSKLSAMSRRLHDYRAYNRLYPLWAALRDEVPVIALAPPVPRIHDRLRFRNIDFWLHRRVIEIEDAQRALRAEIEAAADRLSRVEDPPAEPDLPEAIAHARLIAASRFGGTPTPASDPAAEVAWLCSVARAFTLVGGAHWPP